MKTPGTLFYILGSITMFLSLKQLFMSAMFSTEIIN